MSLPQIYKNKIEREIRNSQDMFYSRDTKSNDALASLPAMVLIETKNRTWQAKIIGKTNNYLVTSNGETISLQDCLSIKKI